ncbi:MAG: hypothetical protein SCJ94_04235 [Bacillota bacterium]|nr:hypothetical protein [Bacillota bacterium]MDW7729203.1 hypothetical protein [Bacillota bacterium]
MKLDFVRGHMGGNLIILLRGDQVPVGRELDAAVKLMGANYLYAHEAGILYSTEKPGQIEVKIAEPTVPCFISACGGFTQVLGAALIETDLGDLFGLNREISPAEVVLHTDCGPTALSIEFKDGKAVRIRTNMECFVTECYERGVGKMRINELEVLRAGKFLVINAESFRQVYQYADFNNWNGKTRKALLDIQDQFMSETGEIEPNVAVYDWQPERKGQMRVVFPHYVQDEFFEPSCGTGSVALGLAALAADELKDITVGENGWLTLDIESGGGIELGGPDLTTLEMKIENNQVKSAVFSHSRVEITAVGEARF